MYTPSLPPFSITNTLFPGGGTWWWLWWLWRCSGAIDCHVDSCSWWRVVKDHGNDDDEDDYDYDNDR